MVLPFLWVGLVAGISLIEAPLKFRAPGVTLPLGLGIGRLVFTTLNRVEWVLALSLLATLLSLTQPVRMTAILACLLGILVVQTFWLLPTLDDRALQIIVGNRVPDSPHHWIYIALELVKLVLLVGFGTMALRLGLHVT